MTWASIASMKYSNWTIVWQQSWDTALLISATKIVYTIPSSSLLKYAHSMKNSVQAILRHCTFQFPRQRCQTYYSLFRSVGTINEKGHVNNLETLSLLIHTTALSILFLDLTPICRFSRWKSVCQQSPDTLTFNTDESIVNIISSFDTYRHLFSVIADKKEYVNNLATLSLLSHTTTMPILFLVSTHTGFCRYSRWKRVRQQSRDTLPFNSQGSIVNITSSFVA
jgi:hypothetical protein